MGQYFRWAALLVLLAGCGVAPFQDAPPSAWGEIIPLAQAQQGDAPALWLQPVGFMGVWVGADDAGVHQDARSWRGGAPGLSVALPLPPRRPYGQQTLPADAGRVHLFWLDQDDDGSNQVYAALLNADMGIERGPTRISDTAALRYALVSDTDGVVWAAWSGGLVSEPGLRISRIDAFGRPRIPQAFASAADYPALIRTDEGGVYLFWLGIDDDMVYRARVNDGAAADITAVTTNVQRQPGDRLENFSAALDTTHTYLFWNITRADGSRETWWTSGVIESGGWAQPQPLRIDPLPNAPLETGFGGAANLANAGNMPLWWAAPLRGQHNMAAAAAQSATHLGIVYFRGGLVIGYEAVVPGARLVGAPGLYADDEGRLALAWAQPTPDGFARLNVVATD